MGTSAANEEENKGSFGEKMGRGNELAVVVREFERGRLGANLEDAERLGCESLSLRPATARAWTACSQRERTWQ